MGHSCASSCLNVPVAAGEIARLNAEGRCACCGAPLYPVRRGFTLVAPYETPAEANAVIAAIAERNGRTIH